VRLEHTTSVYSGAPSLQRRDGRDFPIPQAFIVGGGNKTKAKFERVIEELAGSERRPAEAVIRDARDKLVSKMRPPAGRQRPH
jgi:hypothetical protein